MYAGCCSNILRDTRRLLPPAAGSPLYIQDARASDNTHAKIDPRFDAKFWSTWGDGKADSPRMI